MQKGCIGVKFALTMYTTKSMNKIESMKKISLLLTLIACSILAQAQDSLKIMTFNCEFMWDGEHPEEGKIEFDHKGDVTKAEEHMKHLSEVIRRHNPDVVNLVETEGLGAVNKLNDKFLKDLGYKVYFAEGTDGYTGQDVAMLSKIEMIDFGRYQEKGNSGFENKTVSKNYFAMTKINGHKIAFVSLHFLSRPTADDRKHKRQAQANAITKLASSLENLGYHIVMFGDYNDYDGDDCCKDINNHKPTTNVLWSLKKMDTGDDNDDLINVNFKVPQEERYTAHWDKNKNDKLEFPKEVSGIDHILISKQLEENIDYVKIDHTHDPLVVSDHFPVILMLKF